MVWPETWVKVNFPLSFIIVPPSSNALLGSWLLNVSVYTHVFPFSLPPCESGPRYHLQNHFSSLPIHCPHRNSNEPLKHKEHRVTTLLTTVRGLNKVQTPTLAFKAVHHLGPAYLFKLILGFSPPTYSPLATAVSLRFLEHSSPCPVFAQIIFLPRVETGKLQS